MAAQKKQNRPRLDAIKRHILAGSYDDELWEIKAAIDERNSRRQDAVKKLVEQVYGEGFDVVPKATAQARQVRAAMPASPDAPVAPEPLPEGTPEHLLAAEDEGTDYESRSPIIGSIEHTETTETQET